MTNDMSRFFSRRYDALEPYVPGEQPRDMRYIKLNTNESPFAPSPAVAEAAAREAGRLQLYSDPECTEIDKAIAETLGVSPDMVMAVNGSDEALNFAFMAFADEDRPLLFPDITYGFYPVFARLNHIPYRELPLNDDFTIDWRQYLDTGCTAVIANPNAPTGIFMGLDHIAAIAGSNPNNVLIVDEAYVDFGGQSALGLLDRYPNILVVQTFSKSRSMAGARLGFAVGAPELIADLNTIRYSTNPYNVNRMTSAAGRAALADNDYYMNNCRVIMDTRARVAAELRAMGFRVTDSSANFLFAASDRIGGEELYLRLKARGVLIRHFAKPRIADYNRITVGTDEQMDIFLRETREILEGMK